MTAILKSNDDKIKGSCYMNLKDSTVVTGIQGAEMREQEGARSPGADRKPHRNGEKAFGE